MLRNLISPPSRHFHIIQFILKLEKKSVNLIVKVKTRQPIENKTQTWQFHINFFEPLKLFKDLKQSVSATASS